MLFGEKSLFSEEALEKFKNSGLTHILVVSGSNITYVIIFMNAFLRYLGRAIRIPIMVFSILGYVWFVGFDIPVVRAAIMGSIGYVLLET